MIKINVDNHNISNFKMLAKANGLSYKTKKELVYSVLKKIGFYPITQIEYLLLVLEDKEGTYDYPSDILEKQGYFFPERREMEFFDLKRKIAIVIFKEDLIKLKELNRQKSSNYYMSRAEFDIMVAMYNDHLKNYAYPLRFFLVMEGLHKNGCYSCIPKGDRELLCDTVIKNAVIIESVGDEK